MAGNSGRLNKNDAKRLRKEAGKFIRQRRLALDMTQKNLADALGLEFYTFVSSVETGANQVPPEAVCEWADALKIDRKEFAARLLAYYAPGYHRALFGEAGETRP